MSPSTILSSPGFGHVTPKTNKGKVAVIIYATFGIPLAIAMYSSAADIILTLISRTVNKIEVGWMGRDRVQKMGQKRMLTSILLLIVYTAVLSYIFSSPQIGNLTTVDSVYLVFQSLSTIGYGDISYKHELDALQVTLLIATSSFGIGLTASVITSIVEVVKGVDVVKVIRKFSSTRKTWSLKKEGEEANRMELRRREMTF